MQLWGFFVEEPTTGIKALSKYSMLSDEGIVDADMDNRIAGPYDPTIRHGYLANTETSKFTLIETGLN